MTLRTPALTFERLKVSLSIIGYALMAEYVDPAPFFSSFMGRVLWLALLLEFVRQAWVYRLEISVQHVQRTKDLRTRWERVKARFSVNARFRIRRVIAILAGTYVFGLALNGMTDKCDSALQCALLAPKLALENLPMFLQVFLMIAMGMSQLFIMMYALTKVGFVKIVMPGTIDVTFDDVYGQDKPKAIIEESIVMLEDAEAIEAAGGYMPKGVLIWGPPGTGKTMLAKAAANASTKPLILIPPGAFASTFVGINYLKVFMLFRMVRKFSLRHGGVIVFFDEIDSLGNRGSDVADQLEAPTLQGCMQMVDFSTPARPWRGAREGGTWTNAINRLSVAGIVMMGGDQGTLPAFLAGMDGMEVPRGFINKVLALLGFQPMAPPKYRYLMIGATNRPDALDAALSRAGRFGRQVHMGYPKYEGKLKTFYGYLEKVSHSLTTEDIEWSARNLDRGTGASIQDIVNEGLLVAFRDDRDSITFQDLMNAMLWKVIGEGEGMHEIDEDNWAVAVHEAGHAVVAHHLCQEYTRLWVGSIEKRGQYGGVIASTEVAERGARPRRAALADIAVSLGSRVAEQLIFDEMSTGHAGDGPAATMIADSMVRGGLGTTLSALWLSERGADGYEWEIEEILRQAYNLAVFTLEDRQNQIRAVANLLISEGGTVQGDKIHALIDKLEGDGV